MQNTATPYVPDQWRRNHVTSVRPMWSARWGHAVVVLDESYLPEKMQKSGQLHDARIPVLVLLGGDDGPPRPRVPMNSTDGELEYLKRCGITS